MGGVKGEVEIELAMDDYSNKARLTVTCGKKRAGLTFLQDRETTPVALRKLADMVESWAA